MEIHLNPEREAQLSEMASRRGLNTEELARQVLSCYVDDEAHFIHAVNVGLAQADSGQLIEDAEVWANVEKILNS